MAKIKGRRAQFSDWEEKPVQDYDPEAEVVPDQEAASDSEESHDENAGTEHYVAVGKSKLRRKEPISLGPQYRGSRVSRDALEEQSSSESTDYEDAQEGFDDPDAADLDRDTLKADDEDAEIDSENAFGESDEEEFQDYTFRGSSQVMPIKGKRKPRLRAADFMDDEAQESEDEEGGVALDGEDDDEEEDSEDDLDDSDMDDFIVDDDEIEDGESDASSVNDASGDEDGDQGLGGSSSEGEDATEDIDIVKKGKGSGRSQLLAALSKGSDGVSGTKSFEKDVAKGKAVRQQRGAYDAALNIRIRLQKALVAVNTFKVAEHVDLPEPIEAAEAAAVKLWNALDDYRAGMQAQTGQKRKRAVKVTTSSQEIWSRMQETERKAMARRKAVLDNWSSKVKATQIVASGQTRNTNKFVQVGQPLTMMLENQMQDTERLVKRTRTPRSCAPAQVAQKVEEDPDIYDDADFYQLLLKELVDQRTTDASGTGGQAATVRYAAVKEAKHKKHVDTKASKGRKMRFNVHEKLQNFMAPEDRRAWEQHAIDRFFGTLFGQKMMLNEDGASDDEMEDATVPDEGLRLFKN